MLVITLIPHALSIGNPLGAIPWNQGRTLLAFRIGTPSSCVCEFALLSARTVSTREVPARINRRSTGRRRSGPPWGFAPRARRSYTDKQNTHNMAVSTTLNSKLEQMLEVLGKTGQRINSLESRRSSRASSSGMNDRTGGRRAASRTPDKRPPPPGPPDDDPPPPPPPDRQSPGGGGKKSAAGGNPGDPGKPRCKYVGDGYNHLMAEFHCEGCRGDICEYCFSFKENLCEGCSRNGPRCGVCRESSFLTKGIECQFCRTYYCTRHSAGQDDYRRFGFVQGPCCLACLRDETRRRRDPDGNRVRNRSPGGAPETNPTRSYSPPLRPPVDRFRDIPTGGQPNAADLQSPPKATQPVPLDKRETGYYPGFDPNGTRPKDPSGLEPPDR